MNERNEPMIFARIFLGFFGAAFACFTVGVGALTWEIACVYGLAPALLPAAMCIAGAGMVALFICLAVNN